MALLLQNKCCRLHRSVDHICRYKHNKTLVAAAWPPPLPFIKAKEQYLQQDVSLAHSMLQANGTRPDGVV